MVDDENVLVTGAASGIGRRLATSLGTRGARVAAADIDSEGLETSAKELDWEERGIRTVELDVRDFGAWETLVEDLRNDWGTIDLFVHSAAVVDPGAIIEAEPESIDRMIDVNMKGATYGTRVVGAAMADQGSGHIVNFGSLASLAPVPGLGVYASTKFGVRGLTLAAAQELRDEGVAVTVVMPDTVDTPLLAEAASRDIVNVAFAGAMLTVDDIEEAFFDRILPDRPLEAPIPKGQGAVTKLATLAPGLLHLLEPVLEMIGDANLQQYRHDRDD